MRLRFFRSIYVAISATRARRLAVALLVVATLAIGALFIWERSLWVSLSSAGKVRVGKIAYTEKMTLSSPGLRLDTARAWLGPKLSKALGPYPTTRSMGPHGLNFMVGIACKGFTLDVDSEDTYCEIDLPEGQVLRGTFIGSLGHLKVAVFAIAPFGEKILKLRLVVRGETVRLDVPNPEYREGRPAWIAEPLPQARTVDGHEITLKRVDAVVVDERRWGSTWGVDTEFTVSINGRDATDLFDRSVTISDGLGNWAYTGLFSEPVWNARCYAVRNSRYPFADSEIKWFGRTQIPVAAETMVVPHELLFPFEVRFLAVIGPGRYQIVDDKISAIPSSARPEDAGRAITLRTLMDPASGWPKEHLEVETKEPALLVISYGRAVTLYQSGLPQIFVRDAAGRRHQLKPAQRLKRIHLLTIPSAAETDTVEVGLGNIGEMTAEFFIKPPPPPPPAKKRE